MRRLAVPLLGALLLGGCGGGDDEARPAVPAGDALKIYTSLPRHGDSAAPANAVLEGQRLALDDAGHRAAGRSVKLVALNSAKPGRLTWDPGLVAKNAERAAGDPGAIAYLGELGEGASAISVPVTNDAGIAQLSPLDGHTSLTAVQPGGPRGGPARYYPSDTRTFARLVPTDLSQATVAVDWARERGAMRLAIVHDDTLHGRAFAAQAVFVADARGLGAVTVKEVGASEDPEDYAKVADGLAEERERPDAVLYAGLAGGAGEPLLDAIQRALPRARLYAMGLPPGRGIGGSAGVRIVSATRPASGRPPAAGRVLDRLRRSRRGAAAPVAALYGYESMRLVLEAIERAGPRAGDRDTVRQELLRGGPRPRSVLGDLALTRTGDVADQRVAAFRGGGDGLAFEGLRVPSPPALPPAPDDPAS